MGQEHAILQAVQTAARPAPAVAVEQKRDASMRVWLWPFFILMMAGGWAVRNGKYFESGDDFGYYLGVAGGVMMLTLLLYSLRKHVGFMRNWGSTRHGFKFHMFLGIMGPTLILFHSTFRTGSLNATIALSCMLLVAGSGIIGRVIYRKIHHGLYGRSATLQEVQKHLGIIGGDVKSKFHFSPYIEKTLKTFEANARAEHKNIFARIWNFVSVGVRAQWTYLLVTRELKRVGVQHAEKHEWDRTKLKKRLTAGKRQISRYLEAVVDVSRFHAYERLFSLWHVLHIPFVFMLVISGIAHVIAVHMY